MKTKILFAAVLAALVAGGALAQSGPKQSGPKLYRWVDKQGKVHYDDALPPEAVNEARTEFSTRTGSAVGKVDRALTAEERAAQAAAAAAAEQAAIAANESKRQEAVMMASYATEMDMRRAYGERISLLDSTIKASELGVANLRLSLTSLLDQASDLELSGKPVPRPLLGNVRNQHMELQKQQRILAQQHRDRGELNGEFTEAVARYRTLKQAEAGGVTATATPSPAPDSNG